MEMEQFCWWFDSCFWREMRQWNSKTLRGVILSIHILNQGLVEAADFTRRTSSEEGEDCSISRKVDGHRLLCRSIGLIRSRIAERMASLAKKIFSFTKTLHRLTPQHGHGHSQIGWIRQRTAASSTFFSRCSSIRLLFVSKLERDRKVE